jgi:hypothetical protein
MLRTEDLYPSQLGRLTTALELMLRMGKLYHRGLMLPTLNLRHQVSMQRTRSLHHQMSGLRHQTPQLDPILKLQLSQTVPPAFKMRMKKVS